MKHIVCCFIIYFIFLNTELSAQNKTADISAAQAIEDIDWLGRFISDAHIAPFSLFSEVEWKENIESLKAKLNSQDNISIAALYVNLLPVLYKIKDIHLSLYLPLKKNDYVQGKKYILKLKIKIFSDELYIMNQNINNLPKGSRVLKINNIEDTEIIHALRDVSPSDGVNPWSQNRIAERNFTELFPLLFHVNQTNILEVIKPDEDTVSIVHIAGEVLQKGFSNSGRKQKNRNYHEISLYKSLNAALIRIPSFSSGSSSEFRDFLKFAFGEIENANIEHLILDLRNNEGGYAERGERLLSYLIPDKTPYVTSIIFKKSKMADEIYNKQSRNSELLKHLFVLDELMNMDEKSYGSYDTVFYRETKPSGLVFLGKLYVMVNGLSVSTTGLVCNSLREHRGAFFIGEPGGFTPQGTFGQVLRFTLPNSGISGYVSTIRFNSGNDFVIDSIPFMPDVLVFESIDDFLKNRDPVLEKTLEIIQRKQN